MPALTATYYDDPAETTDLAATSSPPIRRARLTTLVLALLSGSVWLAQAAITYFLPDQGDFGRAPELAIASAVLAAVLIAAGLVSLWHEGIAQKVRHFLPWLLASGLFVTAWEVFTSKTGILPLPFFPPPHGLLEVYADDYVQARRKASLPH